MGHSRLIRKEGDAKARENSDAMIGAESPLLNTKDGYPERIVPIISSEFDINEHESRYLFAASKTHGLVLDLGCGVGYGTAVLERYGKPQIEKVVGFDVNSEALRFGRENYPQTTGDYLLSDASRLPFKDNSFDSVVSLECIEHVREPEAVLGEIRRVLKVGGPLVLSTPNRRIASPLRRQPSDPHHLREWSGPELVSLLRKRFTVERIYGQDFRSPILAGAKSIFRQLLIAVPRFKARLRAVSNRGASTEIREIKYRVLRGIYVRQPRAIVVLARSK